MYAKRTLTNASLASVLLMSTGLAQAAVTYAFTTGGEASAAGGVGNAQRVYGAAAGSPAGSPTLTMTGFVNTRQAPGDTETGPAGKTSGDQWLEFDYAPIAFHGASNGLGIQFGSETSSGGQHATDNSGNQEFMLLSFSSPVALTELQLGWPKTGTTLDSDFMVLRYAGPVAGTPTADGFTASDMLLLNSNPGDTTGKSRGLTTAGWQIMGATTVKGVTTLTTDDMPVSGASRSIGNSTFQSSSFWLVGARNSWLAAGSDGTADFGKLLSVKACVSGSKGCGPSQPPGVPEPSSLALLGVGLLGGVKRWRQKR